LQGIGEATIGRNIEVKTKVGDGITTIK